MKADDGTEGNSQPRGFAGLSSKVSDIEADIAQAAVRGGAPRQESPHAGTPTIPLGNASYRNEDDQEGTGSGLKVAGWIAGGLILLFVLWMASRPDPSAGPSESEPAGLGLAFPQSGTEIGQTQESTPEQLVEEKPPVGVGLTLGTNQIRYCLAEDIRIDAAEAVVNAYDHFQVDQFNASVADYNSRCSSFRYSESSMAVARGDIEARRTGLEEEGRARFLPPAGAVREANSVSPSTVPVDEEAPVIPSEVPRVPPGTESAGAATSEAALSLSGLTEGERQSLDMTCRATLTQGTDAHDQCMENQIAQLAYSQREPDMARLTYDETQTLKRSCMRAKWRGPATYNQCLIANMPIASGSSGTSR